MVWRPRLLLRLRALECVRLHTSDLWTSRIPGRLWKYHGRRYGCPMLSSPIDCRNIQPIEAVSIVSKLHTAWEKICSTKGLQQSTTSTLPQNCFLKKTGTAWRTWPTACKIPVATAASSPCQGCAVKMGDAATTPSMELHSGGYVVFMVRVWKPPMMIPMGHLQNSWYCISIDFVKILVYYSWYESGNT